MKFMEKSLKVLWVFVVLLSISTPVLAQLDNFIYEGFNRADQNISLNGVAEVENRGMIRLTNETLQLIGRAFYPKPLNFKNSSTGKAFSFSTCFAFAIVPEYRKVEGGHGLAFTISATKELPGALPSQYLGLLNSSEMGNFTNHIFAVEFDTVQDFEFGDINDNHVGIDINSLTSNASASAGYFEDDGSTKCDLNLKNGKRIQAWVDYDSVSNLLNVTISPSSTKPRTPLLSMKLDLSPILRDSMYVGFSASTGLLASSHYIFEWRFRMKGQSTELDLPNLPSPKKSHTVLVIAVSVSAPLFIICSVSVAIYLIRKIKNADVIEAWEHDIGPHRFSYKEIKLATKNFREKDVLGFGGFGKVYKGTLANSKTEVAVKRVSHESKQGLREFISEISSIGRLRHRNLVQLKGWCRKGGDLLLVYDYMPNGSLDNFLFDKPKTVLSWEQRLKIVRGVASGLLYLHEEWEQVVVHRDVKASNVLLDSELNGRLGDFGLARLYEHGANPSTTRLVGTLGYLAPELTRTGKGTMCTDVFSFGALLLEVVCGRRPIEPKAPPEEMILVDWVLDRWQMGEVFEVVDPKLGGEFSENEVMLVVKLGLLCSNQTATERPTMRHVVSYLDGELSVPEALSAPGAYGPRKSELGFEDCLHSYPSSSSEKVQSYLSIGEGGSVSPFSLLSGRGDSNN